MTQLLVPAAVLPAEDYIVRKSVSAIVPTYNRSQLLTRAIHSISEQTYQPAEIVVVDDCSSDDTQSVIAAYAGEIPLVYIRLERNAGGGAARNAGIMKAKGEYVAFLDSDDEWQPDHLRILVGEAAFRSGDFAVAGSALRIGKNPKVLPGQQYPRLRSVPEKLHFVLSGALAFQTSTLLMPRETARRFMFDPHLRRHQDWDLIFRMIENDVPMVLLPEGTIKYYRPDTANSNVGISVSVLPSLRFLAKHKASMSAKTRARFITLQIMRRRGLGIGVVKYLTQTMILRGMGPKEFLYYAREAFLAELAPPFEQ